MAIEYGLPKVVGYNPDIIITSKGWPIIKHFLLRMMEASNYRQLQGKTGRSLANPQMKALLYAPEGWEF